MNSGKEIIDALSKHSVGRKLVSNLIHNHAIPGTLTQELGPIEGQHLLIWVSMMKP